MFSLKVQEPKDPPLITNFLNKMKSRKLLELSPSDRRKEVAINLAKKKMMSSRLEDKLVGKAKDREIERRLNKRKFKKDHI